MLCCSTSNITLLLRDGDYKRVLTWDGGYLQHAATASTATTTVLSTKTGEHHPQQQHYSVDGGGSTNSKTQLQHSGKPSLNSNRLTY